MSKLQMEYFEGSLAEIRKQFNNWSTEDHWIQDSEFLPLKTDLGIPTHHQVMKVMFILKSEIKTLSSQGKTYAKK